MTIALLAALAIGEFFTALVIIAFVLAAEVLESLTVGRGRRAIRDLLDFLPRTITVRRDGQIIVMPAEQVEVGDSVVVKPGGHIPVDGLVLSGRSFVEQAAITGEAMPVEKLPGHVVYAGTINQSGTLEIDAQKLGRDTSFGRIVEAVERAEKSRAPIQKTADRLAGYLVYFAIGAAILTFLITRNVRSTISVVIVAGACGIAAGTPLAILGAIGRAARQGAIIKRRPLPRSAGGCRYGAVRQDWHSYLWNTPDSRGDLKPRFCHGGNHCGGQHRRAPVRAPTRQSHRGEGYRTRRAYR